MGAFAQALADFGAKGVPVIPTRSDAPSKPMVLRPDRFGLRACRRLASDPRYAGANAAICTGRRSRLTVVDIDSTDPAHEAEARHIFGDTPISARTPSGGAHLYFASDGEARRIRPFGMGLPIDILGSGLAVCPPSVRAASADKVAGRYIFIEGSAALLSKLPKIRPGSIPDCGAAANANTPASDLRTMREGSGRNAALFRIAREVAYGRSTLALAEAAVLDVNSTFSQPLPVAEAVATARSAWKMKMQGRLIVPGTQTTPVSLADVGKCQYRPALALLIYLRCLHGAQHTFAVSPEGLARPMNESASTIRKAREYLVAAGYLALVRRGGVFGGNQVANLYRFTE